MAGGVSIQNISKTYRGKRGSTAVEGLSLEIEEGEFVVLLGPSGCGKTTTLRCIAGLETPDHGSISVHERTLFDAQSRTNIAPNNRRIGMVFQSYALWPHMTVRKNISYPLRANRLREGLKQGWVDDAAALVECTPLLDRYPGELSGGQQQRVALARGIVARPELVLFDEPLSNLDARLRDQVRDELHELHGRLGFTAVFVTHDQSEALALGDRLAIMRDGRIEQLATPKEIYERPATEYVAGFIGASNRLVTDDLAAGGALATLGTSLEHSVFRIHPEDLHVAHIGDGVPAGSMALSAVVRDTTYGGRHVDITLEYGTTRLLARTHISDDTSWLTELGIGETVQVYWAPSAVRAFGPDGKSLDIDTRAILIATAAA